MKRYLGLYKDFALQYLKSLMQYKVDFIIGFIGFFIIQMSGIIFLGIIFNQIPTLNGWSFYQILFIYGFAQLPRGIDHLITDYLWIFSRDSIIHGDFDRYLLRPLNPLFQVICERLQLDALGEIVVGIIIVSIATVNLNIKITLLGVILFIVAVIAGAVIYTSIKLFFSSLAFWMKRSFPLLCMAYSFSDFAKYPNSIYSKGIKMILSYVVPFAFAASIPAGAFLGQGTILFSVGGSVIMAGVLWTISYGVWNMGMKVYESSGN